MSSVKKISNVTLGSDIEFFLQDKNTGEVISAEGYVKGTKENPFVFDPSNRFWATSLDCVAYEGNIPPASNKDEWRNHIGRLIEYINSTLPSNLCTITPPAHEFDAKFLQTEASQTFGCGETYNVWTRAQNERPENTSNLRSIGKHIHAVWDNMEVPTVEEWIKAMDLFLGVPSVLIEPEELSRKRRTLYGKAGEFRVTEKWDRAEYRPLSAYFAQNEEFCNYTYDQTMRAIDWVNEGNEIDVESKFAQEIISAINNSDRKLAEKIVNEYQIPILA
jgi:hypothetical protein